MALQVFKPDLPDPTTYRSARPLHRRGDPARIFDNVRTAIDKVETGKARQVNARIAAMASHYLFGAGFCNAAQAERRGRLRRTCRMPTYAGRQAMASTATGYARQHLAEQKALVAATLGG
jgi:hypothetical protein